MLRRLMLLLSFMALLSARLCFAEPAMPASPAAPAATAGQKAKVAQILASVKENDAASCSKAVKSLVKGGKALIPAIREAAADKRAAFFLADSAKKTDEMGRNRLEGEVLDDAFVRLDWKIDPVKVITKWVADKKYFDGAKFKAKPTMVKIYDDFVAKNFPGRVFYAVNFPDMPVRPAKDGIPAQMYPSPLARQNIITVYKNGMIIAITTSHGLKQSFSEIRTNIIDQQNGGIDKAFARELMYTWLRLATALYWQDGKPLPFTFSDDIEFSSPPEASGGIFVACKATAMLKNNEKAELNDEMLYSPRGRLFDVFHKLTPNLKAIENPPIRYQ